MRISLFTSMLDGLGKNSEMGKVINWDEEKATKGKGREDEGKRERGWGSAVELTSAGHHSLIPTQKWSDVNVWISDLIPTRSFSETCFCVIVRLLRDFSEIISRHITISFKSGFHHGLVVTRVYLHSECYRFDSSQGRFAFSISRKIPRASVYYDTRGTMLVKHQTMTYMRKFLDLRRYPLTWHP